MVNVPRSPHFSNPRPQSWDVGWAWSTPIALYQPQVTPPSVVPRSPHFSNPRTPSWDVGFIWSTPAAYFTPPAPLPFNQYDWPIPTPQFRIEHTTGYSYNPAQQATGAKPFAQIDWPLPTLNPYGNVTIYTVVGPNNPNIYPPPPTTVKIEWLIRARRRGRR